MQKTTSATERAGALVCDYFGQAFTLLDELTPRISHNIRVASSVAPLTAARLDILIEPFAKEALNFTGIKLHGAGFIAAIDFLTDAQSHLAWWQGPQHSKLVLASQSVNKEHIDYSGLEWYRVPATTGAIHVAGPYVDYLCSDEYTVTVAAPVIQESRFIGVTAIDVLVDTVEGSLVEPMAAIANNLTLINGVGRVVLSTDPEQATGMAIRGHDLERFDRTDCNGFDLAVLQDRENGTTAGR
ncbi:cache domain-containing protein [Humidisolicoccus flavus]|uniref:cache domain-containing protein n=1 Tax=Humidisolicoccus flavus TaxID=3111414 RepID=UPI003254D757